MDFIEEFKSNKRYVFDKDIYIEYMNEIDTYTGTDFAEEIWTNACNNQYVEIKDNRNATININSIIYDILPEWCREVPSIRVLTENDL